MVNTPEQPSRPALTCPCSCHGHGRNSGHPCDWDGGCGHLHTTSARTDGGRPSSACVLCPAPLAGRTWKPADRGYRTCNTCLDKVRDNLRDIPRRYLMLNPRPGASGEHGGRGAPGFGSRSPASDHIITMRDPRSKSCEVIDEWFEAIRIPHNTFGHDSRTNPRLANIDRPYREQDRPVRSVPAVLASLAWMVAEDRDMTPPVGYDVPELCRWLDGQLDYVTRQDWVVDVDQDIRDLVTQLKPVTGDPGRRHIGLCPNVIDEGEHSRECGARLYAPIRGDQIECTAQGCGRVWPRSEWLRLGDLLDSA